MAKGTGVTKRHRDYDKMAPKWRRCRDVVAGEDEIHAGAELYLPKLLEESDLEHKARIARTPFFNATWRTIGGFIGLLYRKPPTLEVSDKLAKLLEDVTMSGVSFDAFAQDVTLEDLEVSRLGVLVDHSQWPVGDDGKAKTLTVAQAEALALRPSMSLYKAESIINWEYGKVDNATQLTQVRLVETEVEKTSEFESSAFEVVRVLDLFEGKYRSRKFKFETEEQIGEDVYPLMNGKPLAYIPFYFIGPDGTDGAIEPPVLIDLVNLNVKHYQVSADYENACHFVGSPTPWVTGYASNQMDRLGNPIIDKFVIGSTTAWVFPDPNTKVGFLAVEGDIGPLEKNLDRKEAQMAAIGSRMLAPEKGGVEAAQTLVLRHAGENSVLAAIAIAVSGGLTKALKTFAEWAGEASDKIKFEINRDFIPLNVDAQTLTAWLAAVQGGRMSGETFFELIKRGDLVAPDVTYEEEQARIDSTPIAAPLADPNAPPSNEPKPKPKPAPKAD